MRKDTPQVLKRLVESRRTCDTSEVSDLMSNISNSSTLRYGFDLDQSCFLNIATNAELILSLVNTFICHPFPLFILIRKSPTMTKSIRRGYIAMHICFIVYEIIFFFLARIYVLLPYPGLYCEGLLCRIGLSNEVILGFIAFSIVLLQIPFAFLIISMHQMFMTDSSTFKLSKRVKISMACVQITIMSLNVVGFVVFGKEPDNYAQLMKEPELAFLANRGHVLLFGNPGNPQYFFYELIFFYFTLILNFSVLCFFIFHSIILLKKISQEAKSTQTQLLTKKMYEVFFWQVSFAMNILHGSVLNHVFPLTALMVFMYFDASNLVPPVALAVLKLVLLISFTLNSTQFCAIFIFKNSANRKMLIDYMMVLLRDSIIDIVCQAMLSIPPSITISFFLEIPCCCIYLLFVFLIANSKQTFLNSSFFKLFNATVGRKWIFARSIISCLAGIELVFAYWLKNLMLYLPIRRDSAILIYVSQISSGSALFSYTTGKLFIVLNRLALLSSFKGSISIYRSIAGAYYALYAIIGVGSNIVAVNRLQRLFVWSFSFVSGDQHMLSTVRLVRPFLYDATIFFDPIMLMIFSKQVRTILYRRIFERNIIKTQNMSNSANYI
uniref:G protein-coupled receptor n=1 Tax=Pristionchus pacificus TaxID=54126 RepID=A0A8R1YXW7_PRIPA